LGVPAEKAGAPFISIFFASLKGRSKKGFPLQSLTQPSVKTKTNFITAFINDVIIRKLQ